jgi:hypothetical protein
MHVRLALAALALGALGGSLWMGCSSDDETAPLPTEVAEGAGCSDTLPNLFPYQPGCCDYAVDVPEVTESGFDTGTVGGSPTPQHVHVSWAGPPDTTFAVNWRSDADTTATQLLYGTDAAAVAAAEEPDGAVKRVTGHHMLYAGLLDGANQTRVHETHVCGLEAATIYHYKVGAPGAWSEVYDVATAPAPGSSSVYSFALLGDSRDDATVWAQVEEAVSAHGVDFQIFTGDAVAFGASQLDWNDFFEADTGSFAVQDLLARTPLMVANGNHDNLAVNYVAQFAFPQEVTGSEVAQGEEWYAFDYANARFLSLNDSPEASATGDDQRDWMADQFGSVDRSATPWLFAFHHRSTYSCGGSHGSDIQIRAAWQPIFDEHKVDVVFSGHDHLYERSKPMRGLNGEDGIVAQADPGNIPVNESGTLYVVSGGAGAPLYGADDTCEHTHLAESTRNYTIVEIEGRTMRYTAYRLDGSILDEFEYSK